MKENTFFDKASLYFLMSSLAIGLVMSIGFLVNLKVEEANQTAQLENIEELKSTELAKVESVENIYVLDQVGKDQIQEFSNETITTFKTIEEIFPAFENQKDAILVVNKPIEELDVDTNFMSFETINNKVKTYFYFHTNASSAIVKATKYKLTPRKSEAVAKETIG